MPLQGVRYRVKTTPKGEKIRLAFKNKTGDVVEAKNLESGATHTPEDFKRDRKKASAGKRLRASMASY